MTACLFSNLAEIVTDLSRSPARHDRFERLLDVFQRSFPCDAVALLQLEGDTLRPRAVRGLGEDVLGRRFPVTDHPRLAEIMRSGQPVRFPTDSPLPDPYDGLVDGAQAHSHVHDCLGAALYVEGEPWGAITLDALEPGRFDHLDSSALEAFVSVAAATARAAEWIRLLEEKVERHQRLELSREGPGAADGMVVESAAMKRLHQEADTVGACDLAVLIQGETGVGKEPLTQLIHHHSPRAGEPMIHVNCAALPENLAESELFGHVRGAFSGASEDREGKFELAHEGTLFLDEVGELPLVIQSKLLRALQDGEVQRVGSDDHHRVDVRVIAATNRDLEAEVAAGRFRADLYHRLSVYPLTVPPLRERRDDILPLTGHFLSSDQRRLGLRGVRLTASARQWLLHYDWPGNVRELEHTISRGVIRALSEGERKDRIIKLDQAHLDPGGGLPRALPEAEADPAQAADSEAALSDAVDDFKRRLIEQRLQRHGGNKAAAAKSLAMDRGNFHRLIKRLGVE